MRGVAAIENGAGLADWNGIGLVHLAGFHADSPHAGSKLRLPLNLEAERGLIHQPLATKVDGIAQSGAVVIARMNDHGVRKKQHNLAVRGGNPQWGRIGILGQSD